MTKSFEQSWSVFHQTIHDLIASDPLSRVLEIGAGARPYLTAEVVEQAHLIYDIYDSSPDELDKASAEYYHKIYDLNKAIKDGETYDLIFSKMVLEHVEYPDELHQSLLNLLSPEGRIVHFFATRYGLPSILNRILPDRISDWIIYSLQKRDPHSSGKFKAYYRQCYGPSRSSKAYFNGLGYQVLDCQGFYGHDYLKRIPGLRTIERLYSTLLTSLHIPFLTSNAIVVLGKKT